MAKRKKSSGTTPGRLPGVRPITVPISPSASQVQVRRESPFAGLAGGGFWQSVGATLAGTAAVAVLVSVLPPDEKGVGALMGGLIGGVATMTSPVGTWISEAGEGALSSGVVYGIMAVLARTGQQT